MNPNELSAPDLSQLTLAELAKVVSELRRDLDALKKVVESQPAPRPVVAASAPRPAVEEVTPDVFAAITAAVHFVLGDCGRVLAITPIESLAWSQEGRRNIFSSHAIR